MDGFILIENGKVWNSNKNCLEKTDILVENGLIREISPNININSITKIDATGKLVLPGCIDGHVHFNDPGFTDMEDFCHGTMAAAAGGVTTIIDMPCTSIPQVTNLTNLKEKLSIVKHKAVVDFGFFGGISENVFNDFEKNMEELSDFVLGFKTYTISGMKSFESLTYSKIKKVIKKANQLKTVILVHSEDKNYIENKAKSHTVVPLSPYSYYQSRDEQAEILAVKNILSECKDFSENLHIVHVGTGKVVEILKKTKATCETAPHYLQFDCNDFEKIGSSLKVNPPVKSPDNKEILWESLKNKEINFVASDHAPCLKKDKFTGSILTDYSGIPGCETMIPYLFSEGYKKNKISLKTFIDITSKNAAKRYGIFNKKGSIDIGKDGDFIIVDEFKTMEVDQDKLYSKGKITPFHKFKFQGLIEKTILRGVEIYNSKKGILGKKGFGKFLTKTN